MPSTSVSKFPMRRSNMQYTLLSRPQPPSWIRSPPINRSSFSTHSTSPEAAKLLVKFEKRNGLSPFLAITTFVPAWNVNVEVWIPLSTFTSTGPVSKPSVSSLIPRFLPRCFLFAVDFGLQKLHRGHKWKQYCRLIRETHAHVVPLTSCLPDSGPFDWRPKPAQRVLWKPLDKNNVSVRSPVCVCSCERPP